MSPVVIDIRSAEDSRDVVHLAVQALAEGELVAFPTETVYGLAACGLNERAVERLSAAKGRQEGHPFTLAIKSADDALDYVPAMSALGQRLARRCWPGPVTLVVADRHPDSLLRQLPAGVQRFVVPHATVGLRVPAHKTIQDVMRLLPGPIVLTSANRTGERDSMTAADVRASLGDDVQLVLDDGRSRYGQPSSVVRLVEGGFEVVREGVVSQATLRRLSSLMVLFVCTGNTCRSPMAETLFRKLLAQRLGCAVAEVEDRGVIVASAGIAAVMGGRPSPEAVDCMARMNLDLSQHETQLLTEKLIRHADIVITMTRSHRQAVISQWPDAAARTWLLCHNQQDVADPIGGPLEQYHQCAQQLRGELEIWARQVDF